MSNPYELYPVPDEGVFFEHSKKAGRSLAFIPADDMRHIAERVMAHYDRFSTFSVDDVTFLWNREGGRGKGRMILGRTMLVSNVLSAFCATEYVIWFGADNCREIQLTHRGAEALVFHELCHLMRNDKGAAKLAGHDEELFADEVRHYGLWKSSLRPVAQAFQMRLDDLNTPEIA